MEKLCKKQPVLNRVITAQQCAQKAFVSRSADSDIKYERTSRANPESSCDSLIGTWLRMTASFSSAAATFALQVGAEEERRWRADSKRRQKELEKAASGKRWRNPLVAKMRAKIGMFFSRWTSKNEADLLGLVCEQTAKSRRSTCDKSLSVHTWRCWSG